MSSASSQPTSDGFPRPARARSDLVKDASAKGAAEHCLHHHTVITRPWMLRGDVTNVYINMLVII